MHVFTRGFMEWGCVHRCIERSFALTLGDCLLEKRLALPLWNTFDCTLCRGLGLEVADVATDEVVQQGLPCPSKHYTVYTLVLRLR